MRKKYKDRLESLVSGILLAGITLLMLTGVKAVLAPKYASKFTTGQCVAELGTEVKLYEISQVVGEDIYLGYNPKYVRQYIILDRTVETRLMDCAHMHKIERVV